MRNIHVAAAQFEHRNADKAYNLARIETLTRRAVDKGAEIISFHECSISGYTFLQHLTRTELTAISEPIPGGPSIRELERIARTFQVVVMAGLVEAGETGQLHNCYAVVGPDGFITKFRKLHTFISPHLSPGDSFNVIDLLGIKAGFLICYDNNLPENVRITAMMGAQVIFMPHVTGCLPSTMPGRGTVDRACGKTVRTTRFACGRNSMDQKAAAGCCAGCRRGRGKTASTLFSAIRSAWTTIPSSPAWR